MTAENTTAIAKAVLTLAAQLPILQYTANTKAYAQRIAKLQKYFHLNKRQHVLVNCKKKLYLYLLHKSGLLQLTESLPFRFLAVYCLLAYF